MIVQSAPPGQPHFVILQIDHANAAGKLAEAFGNESFAPLSPRDPMQFMVTHHDQGWESVDAHPLIDPQTCLPYHLTRTPIPKLIETGQGSPTYNEAYHPYSGLISSMHTWGLYHGRYGLSDKIFIDSFPAEHRPAVDVMLALEESRQARIKAQLGESPETAAWIEDRFLFHNYKLLQFFDTVALYFHMNHARTTAEFKNVPCAVGEDVIITISPVGENDYQITPYPFGESPLLFTTYGRYLMPLPEGSTDEDLRQAMATAPLVAQRVRLFA